MLSWGSYVGNGNSAKRPSSGHMQAYSPFGKVVSGRVIPVVTVLPFCLTSRL
jgi:hypothetical protein